jgi:hypothetical protein
MLKLRVSAVIGAVFFMSSVSAQAMEFADRPGSTPGVFNSLRATPAMPSDDRSRRQINNHIVLMPVAAAGMKLADRPSPVSLVRIQIARMMVEERPGRLSPEFSTVPFGSGIRFEYGPGLVSSWLKVNATPVAMKFENRPGPISNRFKALAAVSTKFEDHPSFTFSLSETTTPFEIHTGPGSVCAGSAAPCVPFGSSYSRLSYAHGAVTY